MMPVVLIRVLWEKFQEELSPWSKDRRNGRGKRLSAFSAGPGLAAGTRKGYCADAACMRTLKHLQENLGALEVKLTPEDLAHLDKALPREAVAAAPYPERA